MEELNRYLSEIMEKENRKPRAHFEGYSSLEMTHMLYNPLSEYCPVQIQDMEEEEYLRIPLVKLVKHLLELIEQSGELKLTVKGKLPLKVVKELYEASSLKHWYIEKGRIKNYKEGDVETIILARILVELSRLIKKRNNKLSLTQKGKKIFQSNRLLFQELHQVFTEKLNWAYFDGFQDQVPGNFGYIFSLLLLSKYGEQQRPVDFYRDKYFKAFPDLLERGIDPQLATNRCYSVRTFTRFLTWYGLVSVKNGHYREPDFVQTTELFKKLIKVSPHQK